jgi:DNA-binding GntR family transcriptional regulator
LRIDRGSGWAILSDKRTRAGVRRRRRSPQAEEDDLSGVASISHPGASSVVPLPLGRVSTTDALVRTLRRRILEGAIPVGAHLAEVELAAAYGVSRQSLRSALAELVHLGLVSREPHRGVRVRVLSTDALHDLWSVRALVEGEAVRRAMAPGANTDWRPVRAAADAIGRLTPASSWADAVEGDLAFHRALVVASGSANLVRLHNLLMGELSLALAGNINNEAPGSMSGEHHGLADLFERGTPDDAVAALNRHLQEGLAIGTRVRLISEPDMDRVHEEEPG